MESRPPIMEDAAIKHIIALCEDTQVPCHIVHLATGNAIRKHKYNFATYSKTINIPTAVFPIYPKFSSTPHKIWLYIHPKLDLRTSQNLVVYSTIIFIFFFTNFRSFRRRPKCWIAHFCWIMSPLLESDIRQNSRCKCGIQMLSTNSWEMA